MNIDDRIENIQRTLASAEKAIKSNNDLTAEAKHRRIEDAHATASADMQMLREEYQATRTRNRSVTLARLAGSASSAGADSISIRDAAERASNLETATEARRAIDRAKLNGDLVLVRAILVEAHHRSTTPMLGRHWENLLVEESRGTDPLAADVRDVLDVPGSSLLNAVRFMLPRLSELTHDL